MDGSGSGLGVGVAPFLAVFLALRGEHDLASEGPDAPWHELSAALGSLLAASVFAAFIVNAGTLAVTVLASPNEQHEAGIFLVGLTIARIPLFLYQAVQAALLPHLAALAGAGRFSEFRGRLGRLLAMVAAIGLAGTLVAFAIGPPVIRLLFGPDFDLSRRDLALLAAGSATIMLAAALGQSLIALSSQRRVAVGWFLGVIAFLAIVAAGNDLFLRVELGILGGALVAALAMGVFTQTRLHEHLRALPHTLAALDGAVRWPTVGDEKVPCGSTPSRREPIDTDHGADALRQIGRGPCRHGPRIVRGDRPRPRGVRRPW